MSSSAHPPHNGKDERLAVVVSVGTDRQVDLVRVGVLVEGLHQAKDGVGRALLHATPRASTPAERSGKVCTQICMPH